MGGALKSDIFGVENSKNGGETASLHPEVRIQLKVQRLDVYIISINSA